MLDILLEKDTKKYLDAVNGTYTTHLVQQILFALIFGGVGMGFVFIIGGMEFNYKVIIGGLIGGLLGFKVIYFRLRNEVKNRMNIRKAQFPEFLKYFNALVSVNNNNIVRTLESTSEYMQEPLKVQVEELVERAYKNEGREAFMDFARFIGTSESIMIMGVLSDFNEHGVDSAKLKDMEETVSKMNENMMNERIIRESNSIEKYANTSLLASIGFVVLFVGTIFVQLISDLNF